MDKNLISITLAEYFFYSKSIIRAIDRYRKIRPDKLKGAKEFVSNLLEEVVKPFDTIINSDYNGSVVIKRPDERFQEFEGGSYLTQDLVLSNLSRLFLSLENNPMLKGRNKVCSVEELYQELQELINYLKNGNCPKLNNEI